MSAIVDSVRCLGEMIDRKSTRLNSSHSQISYAVFCLKKKKNDDAAANIIPESPLNVTMPRHLHLLLPRLSSAHHPDIDVRSPQNLHPVILYLMTCVRS